MIRPRMFLCTLLTGHVLPGWLIALTVLVGLWFSSCASRPGPPASPVADGLYDSECPVRPVAPYLAQAMNALRRVGATARYQTYTFARETELTLLKWKTYDYRQLATGVLSTQHSKAGTAVIVAARGEVAHLLTARHVVHFPDTVFQYYRDDAGNPTPFLESVSLKQQQLYFLLDGPDQPTFRKVAEDVSADLALLEMHLSDGDQNVAPFPFSLGKAVELQWGTRVYVLGFPRGYPMVTEALVSAPNRDALHRFYLDALFNRGFSGGVVLAMRDGPPNFEWVGMVTSVLASTVPVLVPEDAPATPEITGLPYRGPIRMDALTLIHYGITFAISAEAIHQFLTRSGVGLARVDSPPHPAVPKTHRR